MSDALIVAGSIFIFLVCFPALFCGILWVIHRIGGWARLERHFASGETPAGPSMRITSFVIGYMGRYNNIARLHLTEERAHISLPTFFSFAHQDLAFPYDRIRLMKTGAFGRHRFEVTAPTGTTLHFSMYGQAAKELAIRVTKKLR
jgi:hypothetical protein